MMYLICDTIINNYLLTYGVSVWRGFLFLWVLGMGYVILLWHSLSLPLIILLTLQYNVLFNFFDPDG